MKNNSEQKANVEQAAITMLLEGYITVIEKQYKEIKYLNGVIIALVLLFLISCIMR